MELSRVILGPVVTEKAERLKAPAKGLRTVTLRVAQHATKIEIKQALKRFYDVEVAGVRVMRVRAKSRPFGRGQILEKRHPFRKALVTLRKESKTLDIASFRTAEA